MTREEAAQIISMLMIAYDKTTLADETLELYINFMLDIQFEAGKAATLNIIASNKFFPRISEIREAAIAVFPDKRLPAPEEAWAEVQYKLQDVGQYRVPTFSNDVIDKSVKAIGWMNLCMSENVMADRAHFMKIYDAYKNRVIYDALQLPEAKELSGSLREPKKNNVVNLISGIAEKIAI